MQPDERDPQTSRSFFSQRASESARDLVPLFSPSLRRAAARPSRRAVRQGSTRRDGTTGSGRRPLSREGRGARSRRPRRASHNKLSVSPARSPCSGSLSESGQEGVRIVSVSDKPSAMVVWSSSGEERRGQGCNDDGPFSPSLLLLRARQAYRELAQAPHRTTRLQPASPPAAPSPSSFPRPVVMPDPALDSLLALGIDKQKAAFALREHGGEVEAAADWCLSVSSLSPSSLSSAAEQLADLPSLSRNRKAQPGRPLPSSRPPSPLHPPPRAAPPPLHPPRPARAAPPIPRNRPAGAPFLTAPSRPAHPCASRSSRTRGRT